MVRALERAAVAAAPFVGAGSEHEADRAAVEALHEALAGISMSGRIVVGEGEAGEAPRLFAGQIIGDGSGPELDIALDALEGATLAAKAQPDAISLMAAAPRGGLMRAPDIYMDKLAIGPGYDPSILDLDAPAGDIAERLARAKGRPVAEITACVLDRPRHDKVISDLRRVGARINLISDGDVAGVIRTAWQPGGIDMYVGRGGAPEGVLAAAALRCIGGQMLARFACRTEQDRQRAALAGITDLSRIYALSDLAASDTVFVATGVTKGALLDGVLREGDLCRLDSVIFGSSENNVTRVRSDMAMPLTR
jgi:fructose-1,6-bisphosphatase II / sedoheptulose-1,7-bisphosphatase